MTEIARTTTTAAPRIETIFHRRLMTDSPGAASVGRGGADVAVRTRSHAPSPVTSAAASTTIQNSPRGSSCLARPARPDAVMLPNSGTVTTDIAKNATTATPPQITHLSDWASPAGRQAPGVGAVEDAGSDPPCAVMRLGADSGGVLGFAR